MLRLWFWECELCRLAGRMHASRETSLAELVHRAKALHDKSPKGCRDGEMVLESAEDRYASEQRKSREKLGVGFC